jgi:hypothetical protein
MTDEALLRLALQACHDHTAQPVLGDAVLEAGWSHPFVMCLVVNEDCKINDTGWPRGWGHRHRMSDARSVNKCRKRAAKPDRRWCRAVAAALLFGDWQDSPWPCYRRWLDGDAYEGRFGGLDAWLPSHSAEGTFFGLNRAEDPARLAGMRMVSTPWEQINRMVTLYQADVIDRGQLQRLLDVPAPLSPEEQIVEAANRLGRRSG